MAFGLLNGLMLFGLAAMVIPILIHLLNRRRYDVVDWGAMQFLQISEVTRRKVFIEELLLMLLRMGLIGLLVLAMAAPWAMSPLLDKLALTENRDVILVFDGSVGMSFTNDSDKNLQQKAVEWSKELLDQLAPGDNLAVLQAREQVIPVVGELTSDHRQVRKALDRLAAPQGVCDWPQAVEAAEQVLRGSRRSRREIILLSDTRKAGWADERSVRRWELLAPQVLGDNRPRLWMVAMERAGGEGPVPNWSLTPIRSDRALATTSVTFRSTLKVQGQKYEKPYSVRYRVDRPEEPSGNEEEKEHGTLLTLPERDDLRDGRLPLTFTHLFDGPGSHLLSLIVQPDTPERKKDKSLVGIPIKDRLPGDNRQDFAVMLPLLPVLLVDGLPMQGNKDRGAHFLHVALAPAIGKNLLVRARRVSAEELPIALKQDIGPEANTKPRVLILCDVPSLSDGERDVVEKFVSDGGGLLVTHGPRTDATRVNKDLYRGERGLLPTALDEATGNEEEPLPANGTADPAAHPLPSSFTHPALERFRANLSGGLGNARFPRWWKLVRPASAPGGDSASVFAELTTKTPFLVEKKFGKGRVIQCAIPLDDSWNTNIHRHDVPEFAPLAYELVAYLAGARGVDYNLTPGQPLVYQPPEDESSSHITLKPPQGDPITLESQDGQFVHKDTRLPGIYTLTTKRNRTVYYVVHADAHGSDELGLSSADERAKVGELLGLKYVTDRASILAGDRRDLWWWVLFAVIGLLCGEVWMTRRIVKGR